MTWKVGDRREARGERRKAWEITLLGNFSQNMYEFAPESSETPFGTMQQTLNIQKEHTGKEKDLFRTAFAALSVQHQLTRDIRLGMDLSGFYTHEQETFDIDTEYILSEKPADDEKGDKAKDDGQLDMGNGQAPYSSPT